MNLSPIHHSPIITGLVRGRDRKGQRVSNRLASVSQSSDSSHPDCVPIAFCSLTKFEHPQIRCLLPNRASPRIAHFSTKFSAHHQYHHPCVNPERACCLSFSQQYPVPSLPSIYLSIFGGGNWISPPAFGVHSSFLFRSNFPR